MARIAFTVPLVPMSVNHYSGRARNGHRYTKPAAQAFKDAVGYCAEQKHVKAKTFMVTFGITLAKGQRLDVDNGSKLILDGLAAAGVFRNLKGERVSDAYVRSLLVTLDCDTRPERGQTDITVEGL